MSIINLTPHAIHIGERTFQASGAVARCTETTRTETWYYGIELVVKEYGAVTDLPDDDGETLYIVSMMVRQALPHRHDLASPGDLVRDADGKIVGAKNLAVNP